MPRVIEDQLLVIGELGACRGVDPELFYPARGESDEVARTYCVTCPVIVSCLDWALRHERHGVWGNSSERQRRALRRALNIQLIDPETTIEDIAS